MILKQIHRTVQLLVDYDGVERVRFDLSSPYSVSADEWGCSVYTDNSEGYDIASISYYDYSFL